MVSNYLSKTVLCFFIYIFWICTYSICTFHIYPISYIHYRVTHFLKKHIDLFIKFQTHDHLGCFNFFISCCNKQLGPYCYVSNYIEMELLDQKICALKLTSNAPALTYVLVTGMFPHLLNNTGCYHNFRLPSAK